MFGLEMPGWCPTKWPEPLDWYLKVKRGTSVKTFTERSQWRTLTCWVGARGGAVPQQDVNQLESNASGLQADLDQHGLDVGRVHAAVGRHEQRGAGLQQVGGGRGGAGHHGLQVAHVGKAVVEETQPADAVREAAAVRKRLVDTESVCSVTLTICATSRC